MGEAEERIKDVISKAVKLGWIQPNPKGYPLMQLSEVEKCMLGLLDEDYMKRINEWVKDLQEKQ